MSPMRILVIEDEKKTAALLAKGLREAGFVVDVAIDGETGLKQARRTKFALLIGNLTPKEFLLLSHLVRSTGSVVSRTEIAEHVWDVGFTTDTNVVDVVVRRLRAKVDDPVKTKLIHTIRGVGYVLKGR